MMDTMVADAETLARLVLARRSCRAFLATPVPRATIDAILTIAQAAASWCNAQPWQVIVTDEAATDRFRDALYAHAAGDRRDAAAWPGEAPDFAFPERYEGIYQERRRATGWALYQSVGIAPGDRIASGAQMLQNYRLFGAPHVMIITSPAALGIYGAVDCGAYVAHVLLAAESLGIATIAQAALAGPADFVHSHFNIPADRKIVCGVSFGYADVSHPANAFRTTRAPLEQVVRYET